MTSLTHAEFHPLLPHFQYAWDQYVQQHYIDRDDRQRQYGAGRAEATLVTLEDKLLFILYYVKVYPGRTFQCGEGWHSNENAVRFWTPSPRVPKEADTRCYACTTAYATMIQLCNACWAQSKTPTPSPH